MNYKPSQIAIHFAILILTLAAGCQSRPAAGDQTAPSAVHSAPTPILAPSPASQPTPAQFLANDAVASSLNLFEAWIQSQIAYRDWAGVSVGIVYDQNLIYAKGFGVADRASKTPATPDTLYRIASNTKMFTSIALLQLRDAGKLQLDDPVAKHLAWFKLKNTENAAVPITLRHLLTHTAGLPRESPFPYWSDNNFPTREQLINALKGQETVYPPITKMKYSNLGMAILGEVIAAVSGEPYEQYIQRHILDPLDMTSTSVFLPDAHKPRLATGYGRRMPGGLRDVAPFSDIKGLAPAGNMTSSVNDLAKLASLHFRTGPAGGKQVLASTTLHEMRQPNWVNPGWKSAWGLGHSISHSDERDVVGHGGALRGYRTTFLVSPKEKIGVIVLTNCDDGASLMIAQRIFKWIAPPIVAAASPKTAPQPVPADWQKYVGLYRDPWGDAQVLIHNGKLIVIDPTELDPMDDISTLIPAGQHTFKIQTADVFGDDGERVIFEMNEDGTVKRVRMGQNYSYPVK